MTRLFYALVLGTWLAANAIAAETATPVPEPPRLYVIGDSTAAAYDASRYPLTGWAQVLQEQFDETKLVVVDRAISGRSSKSYFEDQAWRTVSEALREGDYLFIQFGHNDSKDSDPNRYTDPDSTYKHFLRVFIYTAKAKGAIPVLLTPINRFSWKSDTRMKPTHGDYPRAVRQLARECRVPLIDMEKRTRKHFQAVGKEEAREYFLYLEPGEYPAYPDGKNDGTHLHQIGAQAVSSLAADGIKKLKLPLRNWLIAEGSR